jgi:hypothetical protein
VVRVGAANSKAKSDGIISVNLIPTYVRLLKSPWIAGFWQGEGGCDLWERAATD